MTQVATATKTEVECCALLRDLASSARSKVLLSEGSRQAPEVPKKGCPEPKISSPDSIVFFLGLARGPQNPRLG